ncbi:MAG: hypothetical protein MUF17_12945, partial [Syntrophales bacterium]|nr:hypothetical protein [Syntrophales bacterium]
MALGALVDDGKLDVFGLVLLEGVDVAVAVAAAEVFLDVVEVAQVLFRDRFVAAAAVDGGGLFLPVPVLFDVRDPRMAARASVACMDRMAEVDPVKRLVVAETAVLGGQGRGGQAPYGEHRQQEPACPESASPIDCRYLHRFHP